MEYNQIINDLKKKSYKPVYFLSGDEPYYIDAICDYIEKNVLDENQKEFNQSVLYGRDVDVKTILSYAKRFPMMSDYQVVIVKEAQEIRNLIGKEKDDEGSAKENKKEKSPLVSYLETPQKSTVLVFCYKYKTVDKRTALAKSLSKYAVLFESKKLYDNKIPDWIISYLKEQNYTIGPKACAMLAEFLGNDLGKIANEISKLIISLPAGGEITVDLIEKNIGISKDYNVFELQKALGQKDVLKSNRIVNYFSANSKDNPIVVTLSSLYGFFNKLLTYHFLADKSRNNAATALGVHPFFLNDYEQAARLYPPVKIKSIVRELREYDLRSKGINNVSTEQGDLLKELVFKILH